jgi:hypothetical protein
MYVYCIVYYIYSAQIEERRGIFRVLVGKPEGKRPLGRTRCRWEDDIKMDLQEMRCGGMD